MPFSFQIGAAANSNTQAEVYVYVNAAQGGYFFLMILMYCLASLPLIYVFSFAPSSELIGFIMFFVINVIACFFDMILTFIAVFSQAQTTTATGATKLSTILTNLTWVLAVLFPSVNFKHALFNIRLKTNSDCVSSLNSLFFTSYSTDEPWMSTKTPGVGAAFLIFCAQIIFWSIILVLIENGTSIKFGCRKCCCKCDKDLEEINDSNQSNSINLRVPSNRSAWDDEDDTTVSTVVRNEWNDSVC
jgi:hypothetical protein